MSLCVLNSKCNRSLRGTSVCQPLIHLWISVYAPTLLLPLLLHFLCLYRLSLVDTHTHRVHNNTQNQHSYTLAHPHLSLSRTRGSPFISSLSHLWWFRCLPVRSPPPPLHLSSRLGWHCYGWLLRWRYGLALLMVPCVTAKTEVLYY